MDLLVLKALEFMIDENLRSDMGQKGRKKSEKAYSIGAEIAKHQDLWDEWTGNAKRGRNESRDLCSVLNFIVPRSPAEKLAFFGVWYYTPR